MFKKRPTILTEPTKFPSGTVVHTSDGFFFVKDQVILRVPSKSVLDSWSFQRIVEATPEALSGFMIAGKLGFRDGTVLKAYGSRKVYLVSGQKTRHITSPEVLTKLGVLPEDYIVVSDEEVAIHKEGEPLGSI